MDQSPILCWWPLVFWHGLHFPVQISLQDFWHILLIWCRFLCQFSSLVVLRSKFAYHAHLKYCLHFISKILDKIIINRAKNNVIFIDLFYNKMFLILLNKKRTIYISSCKLIFHKIRSQSVIIRFVWIYKSFRLLHIHFLQHSIQKCTLHFHLKQFEV